MYVHPWLETDTGLNESDYKFLKADETYWTRWGAAMSVVYEYCRNNGYGGWGDPTQKGLKAMEFYEKSLDI